MDTKIIYLDTSGLLCCRLSKWQKIVLLGRDTELSVFIDDHKNDLFVAHFVIAEISYLLRLGISLPKSWFCTFTAYRKYSNISRQHGEEPIKSSLIAALQAFSLAHLAPSVKEELRERIFQHNFDETNPVDRTEIVNYCFSDCDGVTALYNVIVSKIDSCAMHVWCEYHSAISRMELRGIPIDINTTRLILRSRWRLCDFLIDRINMIWPIYKDGSFRRDCFFAWCAHRGIVWPYTKSKITGKF